MNGNQSKYRLAAAAIAVVIGSAIWLLTSQAVSVGDDLGYAFTDSQLHAGDGNPVESVADIISTQLHHYRTTNGRFLIHAVVQWFVALAPQWAFPAANAIVFLLLWCGCAAWLAKVSAQDRCGTPLLIFTFLLLWICIPRPGVTMLSLRAFAMNYLWTGAATVWLLLLWNENKRRGRAMEILCGVVAFIVGSLQESYSLPLCAGMGLYLILNRHEQLRPRLALAIPYALGTLLTVCAPGNFVRVGAGGGLGSIAAKSASLIGELLWSPISVLAIILIIWIIRDGKGCIRWMRCRIVLLVAIASSVALGILTFTAVRQLFAPALFSALLLGDLILHSRLRGIATTRAGAVACAAVSVVLVAGAFVLRQRSARTMNHAEEMVRSGQKVVWGDASENLYNLAPEWQLIFGRYDADPLAGTDLKFIADGYTKRGLSRRLSPTHSPKSISSVLPAPPSRIIKAAARGYKGGDTIVPGRIDTRWASFALPLSQARTHIRSARGGRPGFERFASGDSIYYIVPTAGSPYIIRNKNNATHPHN